MKKSVRRGWQRHLPVPGVARNGGARVDTSASVVEARRYRHRRSKGAQIIAPRASRATTLDLHNTRPAVGNMRASAGGGLLCGCSQKFREGVLVVAGLISW